MEEQLIGNVDVDAGLIQIGDPGYGYEDHEAWHAFLETHLHPGGKDAMTGGFVQIPHEAGHMGKAIVVNSGVGDGSYPVYITRDKDGTVMSVRVDFLCGPLSDTQGEELDDDT